MSKYQPRININNPPKNISQTVIADFLLKLNSGNYDEIVDYVNKFGIDLRSVTFANTKATPVHIILSLDNSIVDNKKKYKIVKYLGDNGAALDLPNNENIWPIHIAASIQSKKIVEYLIKKGVNLDRLDSSNNSVIHYSIYGASIPCPKKIKVDALIPEQIITQSQNETNIKNIEKKIISILGNNINFNDTIIHMINTIMKTSEMYDNTSIGKNLRKDILTIFADIANTGSMGSSILDPTQDKLLELINSYYDKLKQNIYNKLFSNMDIQSGNSGWGPDTITGPNPADRIPPNQYEKILKYTRKEQKQLIIDKYNNKKNKLLMNIQKFLLQYQKNQINYLMK
jgi:hypothetical protein